MTNFVHSLITKQLHILHEAFVYLLAITKMGMTPIFDVTADKFNVFGTRTRPSGNYAWKWMIIS
jgi:hypothetical protein